MKHFFSVVFSLSFLAHSHSLSAADLIDTSTFPDWFKESLEREIELKKTSKLKIDALKIDHEVFGTASLQDDSDSSWYFTVDIGTTTPIECYVFTVFDGAANSLYAIAEFGINASAQLNKKPLNAQYIMALDVGLIEDTPYLLLDTLYLLGDGKNNVSGVMKGLSARTDNSLQICIHNDLGYNDTFFKVFESFTKAFISTDDQSEFYESVYSFTIGGIPVGYAREKYITDAEGDISELIDSAMLLPVDNSNISRSDSLETSWSTPGGALINGQVVSVENSKLESQFSIQYLEEKWVVDGELQGKEVKKTLEHEDWLISNYGNYLASRNLLASEDDKTEFTMWISDTDPTSVMNITMSKIADNPKANIKYDIGIMAMNLNVDDKGIIQAGNWSQGSISMDFNLLFSKGDPAVRE